MKNAKKPTRVQKLILKSQGFNPDNWLIVKDLPEYLEAVNRLAMKKHLIMGEKKPRVKVVRKE